MLQHERGHIAIFIPSLRGGGAERVMVTLANGFAERGHRVDLVLTRAEGPYLPEVCSAVRIVDLNKGRVLASLVPLARYLRRERPHAMLSALNHANIIAILARKVSGAPTRMVVSEHNSLTSLQETRAGRRMLRLMRRFYPLADGVVAVSRAMAAELHEQLDIPLDRISAIPNPLDIDAIRAQARSVPDHPWLKSDQPPVILAVGRLEPQKDYPTLLEAFARVRKNNDARLVILGEGSLRAELEERIHHLELQDVVDMPGFQPNPFGWMGACSVYVLSSRYEGFPTSLLQAMACGAKIVSTDCPTGPVEILEDGKWGRLVPVGDADALAKEIVAALATPPFSAQEESVYRFSLQRILKSYAAVLSI